MREMTPAFVTIVAADHTVVVPDDVPVGATIAIIVVPFTTKANDDARRARFADTLSAIRLAMKHESSTASPSDHELDMLVEKARKAPRT